MPTSNNYYKDAALTNLSIAYRNPDVNFVADAVFPRLGVKKKTAGYYEFDKASLRAEDDVRAPGTPGNEGDYDLTQNAYGPLIDHALKTRVTDDEVEQSDNALNPMMTA